MDYVNTIAERAYLWSWRDPKGMGIDLEAEMNVTHVVRRPALLIKGTSSN
jgi:hypothetical protein